jgi:hypothetical protein
VDSIRSVKVRQRALIALLVVILIWMVNLIANFALLEQRPHFLLAQQSAHHAKTTPCRQQMDLQNVYRVRSMLCPTFLQLRAFAISDSCLFLNQTQTPRLILLVNHVRLVLIVQNPKPLLQLYCLLRDFTPMSVAVICLSISASTRERVSAVQVDAESILVVLCARDVKPDIT